MDSLPVAISVHHFVSSVGADAGFAAFIAVAILVLLYFAHARETATLRTRADEAAARVEDLEAQVAQLTDQVAALPPEISVRAASPRAAAAYGGVPGQAVPGMPATAGAGAGMLPPAAPAGMAAPALAAATRLIPDPESYARPPAPATTAGGTNGAGHRPVAAPAAAATIQRPVGAPAAVTDGAARTGVPGQGGPSGPGGPGRAPGSSRPPGGSGQRPGGPPRPQGAPMRPPPRRSVGRLVLGVAVAVLGLAVVAAAVLVLTNRGGSSRAHRSAASLTSQPVRHANVIAVRPSTVTVSVLNGTDRVGLAGDISQRLTADGYRKGAVTNFSDQTQTTSVVAYMTPADRPDALAVASSLKLSRSLVQLIDQNTKAIACPPTQACTSQVVVTIGHDLAQ